MLERTNSISCLEYKEQIAFVKWLQEVENIKAYHFPPGRRGGKEGHFLKMMGVKSGVADVFIPSCFLWVELKRINGGCLSQSQKIFRDEMLCAGYCYILAHGFNEAKQKFLTWREYYEQNCNNIRISLLARCF